MVALFGAARVFTCGLTAGGDKLATAIPHSYTPAVGRGGGGRSRGSRLSLVQAPIRATQSLSSLGPKAE